MRTVLIEHDGRPDYELYKVWLLEDGKRKFATAIFYDDTDELGLVKRVAKWLIDGK